MLCIAVNAVGVLLQRFCFCFVLFPVTESCSSSTSICHYGSKRTACWDTVHDAAGNQQPTDAGDGQERRRIRIKPTRCRGCIIYENLMTFQSALETLLSSLNIKVP